MDRLFELLFKYPLSSFASGHVRFQPSWPFWAALAALVVVGLPALRSYWRRAGSRAQGLRFVLRLAALALVLGCLARPLLVLSTVVPQESFVGVVVDESESMAIADDDERSRGDRVLSLLGSDGEDLLGRLAERFKVRLFGFSHDAHRVGALDELSFTGRATRLGSSLEHVADELSAVPLAGLVVLTDGADNSDDGIEDAGRALASRGVPTYAVGIGERQFRRDVQVSRIEAPARALRGSSLSVEVTLEQNGLSGETVDLEVLDEGRIVATQPVHFPATGEAVVHRATFRAGDAGPRQFQFRVPVRRGEAVVDNNRRTALIAVDDETEKILYFEGEPRPEVKFMRRAVKGDDNLQLVVLQRTAENRYMRLDLDRPDELEGGFPTRREDLFEYRGLVLGSIEASFFTYDQLRMIADFVSQRGGGFLMIGGRRAFSEGGWAGTPVADMMPVVLGPSAEGEGEPFFAPLSLRLTQWGRTHPALQLADSEEASAEAWAHLPVVSTFNPVTRLKPGATSLIVADAEGVPGDEIVLAYQRYGRGKSLAWTVHDSWRWQMNADVPLDDMTHETFWRQMLRWVVSYVPDQVQVETSAQMVGLDDALELRAEVRDEAYLAVNTARVDAVVTAPSGAERTVPLEWSVEKDGEYRGSYLPTEEGLHRVEVAARHGDEPLGTSEAWFEVGEHGSEPFDAELREAALQHLAEQTGGAYYTPAQARRVIEDLSLHATGSTRIEQRDLWDMPILALLLLGLLCAEWVLRRRAGVA